MTVRSRNHSLLALLLLAAAGPAAASAREGAGDEPFDWIVPPGVTILFDTVSDIILGGDGAITGQKVVVGGVIDVRDVFIPDSSTVVFLGPNPVSILASGDVFIGGALELSGAPGQQAFINVPAPPTVGRAGGGDGGGSYVLPQGPRPRGLDGSGAFGRPNAGGQGGEASFHPLSKDSRRGSGGGGGRFGPDVVYTLTDSLGMRRDALCQTLPGMDAEPGFDGGPEGTGAASQVARAQGGALGLSPFQDASEDNDFFGVARTPKGLVVGELERPWAGAGGGSGGNSIRSDVFPPPTTSGEFGGAGGAGGGSLTILALGEIVVDETGEIHADGGHGGGGENTNFLDRVGGGGGGGSGGHIILQSATRIRILAIAEDTGPQYADPLLPGQMAGDEHPRRPISALGGQGAVGRNNVGGARTSGPGSWRCDGIDRARLDLVFADGATLMVPPLVLFPPPPTNCYLNLESEGSVPGAGGDGGPGVIQLHVPDPTTDIITADPDLTRSLAPRPVGWRDGQWTKHLYPMVGAVAAFHAREMARRAEETAALTPRER